MVVFRKLMRSLAPLCALLLVAPRAHAQDESRLIGLINAERAQPALCGGASVPALVAHPLLARINLRTGSIVDAVLETAGYAADRADAISINGPADATDAMTALRPRYCAVLLDPHYAHIGVMRQGAAWTIVLAQPTPLLTQTLPEWHEAGQRILAAANRARAQGQQCGGQYFGPAPPLAWNDALGDAAFVHSGEMVQEKTLTHRGRGGSDAGDRARAAGYHFKRIGENIANGQRTPQEAVDGWLTSPGHCANLMNPLFRDMGAAVAVRGTVRQTAYWTQVLGAAD